MTKREKAVAIAKDVLKQLRAERYHAHSGVYIQPQYDDWTTTTGVFIEGESLQKIFKSRKIKKCNVCALGSAYVSYVRLYNKDICQGEIPGDHQMMNPLEKIFSSLELIGMEACFEGAITGTSEIYYADQLGEHETITVNIFARQFAIVYGADERLTRIMKNIIKNKGKFVIEGLFDKKVLTHLEEKVVQDCSCQDCESQHYAKSNENEEEAYA